VVVAFLLGGARFGVKAARQQSFAYASERYLGFWAEVQAGCGQFSKSDVVRIA